MTSSDKHAAQTGRIRTAAEHHSRRVLSAYNGEHAVYGVVLVTALIAVGWADDTDAEVLAFVLGTMVVFWLAHLYAYVVASRAQRPPPPLRTSVRHGVTHTSGMMIAMIIPAALLGAGVVGLLDEYTSYFLALGSGVVLLAAIGYANAARNRSSWPWRVAGTLATTLLGLIVVGLSIVVH